MLQNKNFHFLIVHSTADAVGNRREREAAIYSLFACRNNEKKCSVNICIELLQPCWLISADDLIFWQMTSIIKTESSCRYNKMIKKINETENSVFNLATASWSTQTDDDDGVFRTQIRYPDISLLIP